MKHVFTIIAAVLISANMFLPQQVNAQSPEKMSYQAVIRDANSNLIKSTVIGMKISILTGSSNGTVVYSETQTPTTNANGLVSIQIGGGAGFSSIDWGNGLYFIKTETDITGGSSYTISGTSQLLSVPFSLHAKTAESITGTLNETDPIFVASAANGITGTNITNWSAAYGWGNHASAGYLTSFTETDPKIGANTLGYSPKWDGTSLVAGAIFQDDSGFVGIGTATPTVALDVIGVIKTNDYLKISNISNASKTLFQILNGNGNGINMGVEDGHNTNPYITFRNSGNTTIWKFKAGGSTYSINNNYNNAFINLNSWDNNNGEVIMGANGSEALRITNQGRLGIGTITPTTPLDVNGIITATDGNSTNWNTAYGWGNHASAGYLTSFTETDPIFVASAANGITGTNITNWETSYGWGNHASAGYLTSFSETDPKIGTNSTNYLPKWDGTSLVTSSIINNGNNVGIGTANPRSVLDISGGFIRVQSSDVYPVGDVNALEMGFFTSGGYAFLQGYNRGTDTYLPIEFSGSTVGFRTNGNKIMTITSAGYAGIGTETPSSKLEVVGTITATSFVKSSGTSSQFLKADGSVDSSTYLTSVREVADEFTATASQTDFNLAQTPSVNSKVKMYINGIRISKTAYSNTGTTLTYIPANNGSYTLSSGDRIQFDYYY